MKESPVARSEDIRTYLQEGCTIICIAANKEHIGYIILSDTLRKESMETIEKIKAVWCGACTADRR